MANRTRKFFGTLIILVMLALYLPLAMLIGANHFTHVHAIWQLLYFLGAGMLWVIPAGLVIRWMVRPKREEQE